MQINTNALKKYHCEEVDTTDEEIPKTRLPHPVARNDNVKTPIE